VELNFGCVECGGVAVGAVGGMVWVVKWLWSAWYKYTTPTTSKETNYAN